MPKKKKKSHSDTSVCSNESIQSSIEESFLQSQVEDVIPEKFSVLLCRDSKLNDDAKLLKSAWKNIAFVHPAVLRHYEISQHILISGGEKIALCVVFPIKNMKKSSIFLPRESCNFCANELVTICKYEDKITEADEVVVSLSTEINVTQNISEIILLSLCHRFIFNGLCLQVTLFDRLYQFQVKKVLSHCDISSLNLNEKEECAVLKFYTLSYKTSIHIEKQFSQSERSPTFNEIGGLKQQLNAIQKYINLFLSPENKNSVANGILMLLGESGTGKSLVLEAICNEYQVHVEKLIWSDIYTRPKSEVKIFLRDLFKRAVERSPSFIILDNFNYLCPNKVKSDDAGSNFSVMLSDLFKEYENAKVLFIAATNEADKSVVYDNSLLSSSRKLQIDIKFNIPTISERVEILNKILASKNHNLTVREIEKCANLAHSFTGKDFISVIKDAELISFSLNFPYNAVNDIESETINYQTLKKAIRLKRPSMVSSENLKVKRVEWKDIGGMDLVKQKLKELVEWPLKYPEAFKRFQIEPPRGVLLYGPPGCSKTMLVKALATECDLNFMSKNISDLFNKYVGESEKSVRDLFALAKSKAPCVIFLDEIDALVSERGSSSGNSGVNDRITTSLLTEIDGIEELHGVIIIAATNRPDMLDDALVRNGRINHFVYVPLPDEDAREKILKISMRNRKLSDDFDFKYLTKKTEGYSGAEIVNICNEAAFQLLEKCPTAENPVFTLQHFENALESVFPRTSKETIEYYDEFYKKHSSH